MMKMKKKMKMIEIVIPFKTPTVNHLYGQRPGGFGRARFIKPEARKIRKKILELIDELPRCMINDLPKDRQLKVTTLIHENWYTKKGEVKKKDISNREKFLIDSVFSALGIDDKFIFEHTMRKVQSDEEKVIIRIEQK